MAFIFLALGKSTPGWCPKESKLGGQPNHVHGPRKIVPLGIVLKMQHSTTHAQLCLPTLLKI